MSALLAALSTHFASARLASTRLASAHLASAHLGIDGFEHPAWLPWLLLAASAAILLAWRARPDAIAWPDAALLRSAGARRRDPVRGCALALRAAALACLALVLAGPVGVHRAPPEPGTGLDLVLAVDASGSMRALDAQADGEPRTRLELAREVVARFARERAAVGDRVALGGVGDSAFTQCPHTSDGALLCAARGRVEAGNAGEATARGDAHARSVKRVGGDPAAGAAPGPSAGRVVVLLTDGRHNAGALSVEAATAIAAAAGVRVHPVAIGSSGAPVAMAPGPGESAPLARRERHDVDADGLQALAAATGGRFLLARRSSDLAAVYAEIDRMERVARAQPARVLHTSRPEPLLAAGLGLVFAELALARILRRRIP
jgi:Ca-activated chloride channel family protein